MQSRRALAAALLLLAPLAVARPARAQATYDPVAISVKSLGHGKVSLTVTAGQSGTPNGFALWWMTSSQFASLGYQWPTGLVSGEGWVKYTGVPTLNVFDGEAGTFLLGPNQTITVEVGDMADETGLTANMTSELAYGESYVFCGYARGGNGIGSSALSTTETGVTTTSSNCTYTVGYWKTHPSAWHVSSLTLGTVTYSSTQLQSILNQPVAGNGLISLSHQLIAAKLNLANGADPTAALATITSADAMIGALVVPPVGTGYLSPGSTTSYTQTLDNFNNGIIGPGHCGSTTPVTPSSWGGLKALYGR